MVVARQVRAEAETPGWTEASHVWPRLPRGRAGAACAPSRRARRTCHTRHTSYGTRHTRSHVTGLVMDIIQQISHVTHHMTHRKPEHACCTPAHTHHTLCDISQARSQTSHSRSHVTCQIMHITHQITHIIHHMRCHTPKITHRITHVTWQLTCVTHHTPGYTRHSSRSRPRCSVPPPAHGRPTFRSRAWPGAARTPLNTARADPGRRGLGRARAGRQRGSLKRQMQPGSGGSLETSAPRGPWLGPACCRSGSRALLTPGHRNQRLHITRADTSHIL